MFRDDKDYAVSVKDERNQMIQDKTNAMNSAVLVSLIGFITVLLIGFEYYISALLTGSLVLLQPLILNLINKYYEKKY